MQLRGCGTALVTPFHQDGSIDEIALRNLVSWQLESGIGFLVPCGTTGETPTLSHDEWLRVIDITIEVVAGRVPVVAGATSNSTHDAVEKAKEVASRKIRVNVLAPGPIENSFQKEIEERLTAMIGQDGTELINRVIPMGRHAAPEEIARTALFLASDQSSFSTGSVFMADGGLNA